MEEKWGIKYGNVITFRQNLGLAPTTRPVGCTDYLALYSETEMYLLKYRSKMDCSVSVH